MANFFQDIKDAFARSAERGRQYTESQRKSDQQVPSLLSQIPANNFFHDVVNQFHLERASTNLTPPSVKPREQEKSPITGFTSEEARKIGRNVIPDTARFFTRPIGQVAAKITGKPITPGTGQFPKTSKFLFGEEPIKVPQGKTETGLAILGSIPFLPFGKIQKVPGIKNFKIAQTEEESLLKISTELKPELEAIRGKALTHEEVIQAAKESDILRRTTSRAETLRREASLLKTRQNLAALAKGKEVDKEFVDNLKIVSSEASALGRQLEALKTEAMPELHSMKVEMIKKLIALGKNTDEIVTASKGVDFTNAKQAATFYRQFVKPKFAEYIDEYRYINLLSSPKTHIVNAFSNLLQSTFLNPITRLYAGGLDFVASGLRGVPRTQYIAEVPVYYKGFFNSIGDAVSGSLKALSGESPIYRPDISKIPTGSKILAPFMIVPKLMEASDIFFRTLVRGGEMEALALRASKSGAELNASTLLKIGEMADEKAAYFVFRKALDPKNKTGQGALLSAIDEMTSSVYRLRNIWGVKWFIPFVQTPMNILKQGIEYSPAGVLTTVGSANKTEQLAKTMIGSTVFIGAAYIAMKGDSTWAAPTDPKEKEWFYASSRKPYSLRVGNEWISYSRLGPLAFPIAMASAIRYYTLQNPKRVKDSDLAKMTNILGGISGFFADQSYLEGMGDLVDIARGDITAPARTFANIPSQLVPLSSFQRWVAVLVDPIYRKTPTKLSTEAIVANLKAGIPGFSKQLPAYQTPFGEESRRDLVFFNQLSPIGISFKKSDAEQLYQLLLQNKEQSAELSKMKEDLKRELGL